MPALSASGGNANYYIFNLETLEKEAITKSAYLMKKFGSSAYQKISETIASFVQCDAAVLPNREVFVIFPNGQCGLFDPSGKMLWNKTLSYNNKNVSSLAADGEYVWCCCKDENCVIRYSADNFKVDLRIGGRDAQTFTAPSFLSANEDSIYVCCDNRKLRRIDKKNFTVTDVSSSIPSLQKFYRFGKYSLICTLDGAYIAADE